MTDKDLMFDFGSTFYAVAGDNFPNLKMPPVEMICFLKHPWVHQFFLSRESFKYFSEELMEKYSEKQMNTNGPYLFTLASGLAPIYAESLEAENLLWHLRKFGMDHVINSGLGSISF